MPKKTATARSAAQRNKPRVQKNIELVRQPKPTSTESSAEPTAVSVSATATTTPVSTVETPTTKTTPTPKATSASKAATRSKIESTESVTSSASASRTESPGNVVSPASTSGGIEGVASRASKGSASERLAARRQTGQKQRTSVTLISADNYFYVRKDLIFIAILAAIMFLVIIILHFVPAIGG